jgi:hypothetical protein
LDASNFSKKQIKFFEDELSRATLFSSIFSHELDELADKTPTELSEIFKKKFPEELIEDERTMETFNILGKRMAHIRDKYNHVKLEAIKCVNVFLSVEVGGTLFEGLYWRLYHNTVAGSFKSLLQCCDTIANIISKY